MKVALVCDWLTNIGGAERVLKAIHEIYPTAPIFTSQYNPKGIDWFTDADVRIGWLQIFPTKFRRILGPLRQLYFNHLDLSQYDLIISVTGAEAKSIKKGNAIHLCYCHAPTQYYWQFYDEYTKDPGFGWLNPIVRFFFKLFVRPLKKADFKAAQKPDYFITISKYAQELIKKYYKRNSVIIAPPVSVKFFSKNMEQRKKADEAAYITTSRQVTWKRLDLAIEACVELKKPLILIGDGPEHERLKKIAGNSELITFLPPMEQEKLKEYLGSAKGYIFPSLEPFGIAPVEALASGCPVIAFGKGGAVDYVEDGKNGVFFKEQTKASLVDAVRRFEKQKLLQNTIVESSAKFSTERFDAEIKRFIDEKTKK